MTKDNNKPIVDTSDEPRKVSEDSNGLDPVQTKKQRLEALGKTAGEAFANAKDAKKVKHEIPEFIKVSELSDHSQDVFQTFGIECAATLISYSCSVEDALVEQVRRNKECTTALVDLDIINKELSLENALLNRRLKIIQELINRKQLEDISELL